MTHTFHLHESYVRTNKLRGSYRNRHTKTELGRDRDRQPDGTGAQLTRWGSRSIFLFPPPNLPSTLKATRAMCSLGFRRVRHNAWQCTIHITLWRHEHLFVNSLLTHHDGMILVSHFKKTKKDFWLKLLCCMQQLTVLIHQKHASLWKWVLAVHPCNASGWRFKPCQGQSIPALTSNWRLVNLQ